MNKFFFKSLLLAFAITSQSSIHGMIKSDKEEQNPGQQSAQALAPLLQALNIQDNQAMQNENSTEENHHLSEEEQKQVMPDEGQVQGPVFLPSEIMIILCAEDNPQAIPINIVITESVMKFLSKLKLVDQEIDDTKAKVLSAAFKDGSLIELDLANNQIGNDGAEALGYIRSLERLTLTDNNIKADGIEHLAKLKNLKALYLHNEENIGQKNELRAEGAWYLANGDLKNLEELGVNDNNIQDEGVGYLADGNLKKLKTLYVRFNKIGNDGAEWLATSNTLPMLTKLCIEGNNIGAEGKAALIAKFGQLQLYFEQQMN